MAPGTNSHCLVTSHAFRYVHKGSGYFWNGCIVSQTWSARDVGPNITGSTAGAGLSPDAGSEGCVQTATGRLTYSDGRYSQKSLSIDASLSSSIYNSTGTVQPNSVLLLPCIKS